MTTANGFSIFTYVNDKTRGKLMSCRTVMASFAKGNNLEERIAENMARFGGSHEFWERRLTHGWDALEAKLKELHAQGLTDEQIISNIVESWGGKKLAKNFNKLMKGEN